MSNTAKRLVGLFLLILGCLWILDTVNLIHIKIFFEGWWTLFIILPCVVALFNDNDKTGPVIGISVGVILLLCAQGIIDWSSIWKLILAIFAIVFSRRRTSWISAMPRTSEWTSSSLFPATDATSA